MISTRSYIVSYLHEDTLPFDSHRILKHNPKKSISSFVFWGGDCAELNLWKEMIVKIIFIHCIPDSQITTSNEEAFLQDFLENMKRMHQNFHKHLGEVFPRYYMQSIFNHATNMRKILQCY